MPPRKDVRFQSLKITDFTTGIVGSPYKTISMTAIDNAILTTPDKVSALPYGTFGCIAYPAGGLGPLMTIPSSSYSLNIDQVDNSVANGTPILCQGFIIQPNTFENQSDQVISYSLAYEYAGNVYTEIWGADLASNTTSVVEQRSITGSSLPNLNVPFFNFSALVNSSGGIGLFYPIMGAGVLEEGIGVVANGVQGQVNESCWYFSHQGRVIQPVATTVGTPILGINFTDPPESLTFGTQNELFQTNFIDDYTSYGSVSSDELLLLTRSNGGIVITGDVFSPYVTTVPGIQPTGAFTGRSNVSQLGVTYMSSRGGAWVWNGGASSQCLSANLPDQWWNGSGVYSSAATLAAGQFPFVFNVSSFGNWLLFQDNWIYDITTQSWWQHSNPTTKSYFYYNPVNFTGAGLHGYSAAPLAWTHGDGTGVLEVFEQGQGFGGYTWQCNPIILAEGRYVDIRQIVVTASGPVGSGSPNTVAVNLYNLSGNLVANDTITISGKNINQYRIPVYVQTDIVSIQVVVTASTIASNPIIIHEIDLEYETSVMLAVT